VRPPARWLVGCCRSRRYFNFGSFHFGNYFHVWDTFHYYVGSKYFKEMSYDRLYECVAGRRLRGPEAAPSCRAAQIMNLRTNMDAVDEDILAHPDSCKSALLP